MPPYRLPIDTADAPWFYARKQCERCQQAFLGRSSTSAYCSDDCQQAARNLRRTEKRYYAAHRKRQKRPVICATCGGTISADRATKRYCSDKCRQQAYRDRAPSAERINAALDGELRRIKQLGHEARALRKVREALARHK